NRGCRSPNSSRLPRPRFARSKRKGSKTNGRRWTRPCRPPADAKGKRQKAKGKRMLSFCLLPFALASGAGVGGAHLDEGRFPRRHRFAQGNLEVGVVVGTAVEGAERPGEQAEIRVTQVHGDVTLGVAALLGSLDKGQAVVVDQDDDH